MGTVFDAGVAVAAQALGARVHNVAGVAIIQPDARAHASSNLRVGEGSLLTDYHHAELASSPRPNKEAATSRLEVRLVEAASQPVGYAELFYYTWSVILAGFWSLAMTFQHVTVYHHMAKQMPTVGARLRLKASLELYRHVVRAASAVTIVAGMARKKFFESLNSPSPLDKRPLTTSSILEEASLGDDPVERLHRLNATIMSDFVGLRVKLVDRLVVLVGTVFEALCSITCLTLLCVLPTSLLVSDALMGISTPPDAPDNGTSLYRVMIYVALVQWATPPIAVLSVGFAVMLLLRQTASTVADMDADFACSLLARQRTERNVEAAAAADRLAASKARGEKIDPALSEGRAKPLREAKKDFAIKVEGDRHVVVGKATEGTPGAGGEGAPAPAAAPSGSNDDNGDADNYEDASGLTVDSPPAEVYLSMEREDFVRAWDMSKRDLEDAVGTLSSNVTVCLQLITLGAAVVTALLVVIFGITQPLIQRILVGALMGLTVPWCYGLGALTTPARTYGLLVLAETASIVNVVLGVDLAPPEAARSRAADGENPGDKSPTKAQIKGQEAKKRLEELRLGAKIHVAPAKTQVAPADADPASPAGSALRGRKAQAGADALP